MHPARARRDGDARPGRARLRGRERTRRGRVSGNYLVAFLRAAARRFDAEDVAPLATGWSGLPPYVRRTRSGWPRRYRARCRRHAPVRTPRARIANVDERIAARRFSSPLLVAVAVQQRAAADAARDGVGAPRPAPVFPRPRPPRSTAPHGSARERQTTGGKVQGGKIERDGRGEPEITPGTRTRASRRFFPATAPRRRYPASPARGRFPTTTSAG